MATRRMAILRVVTMLVFVSALHGCTSEQQEGTTLVIRWDFWVPWLALVAAIATTIAGLFLGRMANVLGSGKRSLLPRLALVLTCLPPVISVILVPELFKDQVTVSPEGFSLHTGFWWAPRVVDVRFADLSRIELVARKEKRGHADETERYLVCYHKDGGCQSVPDGTLMQWAGAAKILQMARAEGVQVEPGAKYAAIAYSPASGKYGSATDCSTLFEAERVARDRCRAEDARVVTWSRNAWCALAVGEDRAFGYAEADSSSEAKRLALAHCRLFTKTPCHIAVVLFSGGGDDKIE